MKKLLYTFIAIVTLAQCRNNELSPHLQENKPLLEVATSTTPSIAVLVGLLNQTQPQQPVVLQPGTQTQSLQRNQLFIFIRPTIFDLNHLPNINNQ